MIGVPDEEAGEVPKAFVVLVRRGRRHRRDHGVRRRAGRATTSGCGAFEVVDEIPKSASGKILRRVLIERERA